MSKTYLSNNKFDNNDNNWNNDKNDNHTNKDSDKNFVSIFFFFFFFFTKIEDTCFIQKIFYNLFYEYQNPVIPETVDNWEELDAEGKKCMTGVNVFYSSLHFL